MATASLLPQPRAVFYDSNGNPLVGGKVNTYVAGSTTPKTTWQDTAETTANTNPVVLDSAGSCLLYGEGAYQITVTDASGNAIAGYSGVSSDGTSSTLVAYEASLASLTNAVAGTALVGYLSTLTGGVGRTLQSKLRDVISAADFGAVGDGATDDTAALVSAIAAARGLGRALYIPGTTASYKVSAAITLASPIHIYGDYATTRIKTTSTTADIFVLTGVAGTLIDNITLDSSVTRTGGSYISMPGIVGDVKIRNCHFNNHWRGIMISGTGSAIIDVDTCYFFNCVTNGVGISISAGFEVRIRHILMNSGASPQPDSGIAISACADVTLEDVNIIAHQRCLLIAPAAGQEVDSVWATDCYFDTSSQYGLLIQTVAGSNVQRCRFIGCWFSSHTLAGSLLTGAAGTLAGIEFVDCHAFANGTNGFETTYGTYVTYIGCQAASNGGSGMLFAANVGDFTVDACTLGPTGGFGANGGWGLSIAAGNGNHFIVTSNRLYGNGSGSLTNGATGVSTAVANNISV